MAAWPATRDFQTDTQLMRQLDKSPSQIQELRSTGAPVPQTARALRDASTDPVASGFYTDTLYPTTYIVTVIEEGEVGAGARFRFERADGRSPGGERVASETATLLDEGVEIAFSPGFLSVGDQFFISAGEKLEYSFGAQIILQSEEQIELSVPAHVGA